MNASCSFWQSIYFWWRCSFMVYTDRYVQFVVLCWQIKAMHQHVHCQVVLQVWSSHVWWKETRNVWIVKLTLMQTTTCRCYRRLITSAVRLLTTHKPCFRRLRCCLRTTVWVTLSLSSAAMMATSHVARFPLTNWFCAAPVMCWRWCWWIHAGQIRLDPPLSYTKSSLVFRYVA